MVSYLRNITNRHRLMDILTHPKPRLPFYSKTPEGESKKGRKYHIREKYVSYSKKKIESIASICAILGYCAGIADRIEESNDLEKDLNHALGKAKLILPKKVYDTPEVQQYVKKIKQSINYIR